MCAGFFSRDGRGMLARRKGIIQRILLINVHEDSQFIYRCKDLIPIKEKSI